MTTDPIELISDPPDKSIEGLEAAGYNGPGWYFWEETWTALYGPYETEEIARAKLKEYCDEYLR